MKISWDLVTWISIVTTVEAERLSVSKITELFWNKIELPKSPRGIQWHQCGKKPKTPKNAQDVVCNGDRCHVICNKGAKRQSRSVTKCQKKQKQFKWTNGGVLNDCAACPELGKPSRDLVANCQFRVCTYKCKNSNHFIYNSGEKNTKQKTFVCKCPKVNGNDRSCYWDVSNGYSRKLGGEQRQSFDRDLIKPENFECKIPNHRLKCSEKPASCSQVRHIGGSPQAWIENRYACRNCFNLKIKFRSFQYQDDRDFLEVQFSSAVTPTGTFNYPIVSIENQDLNAFRIKFAEGVNLEGQNVDLTAEFRSLGDKKAEILAVYFCPCSVPRGALTPKRMITETEVKVETSFEYHPNLLDANHKDYVITKAKLLNAFNSQDFSITDVKFAAKVVEASNPLGSQNPESRCVQQLEVEGGNECVRYESHFKCLVPAQGITSCETIKGCGLEPKFERYCGTEEKQVCTNFDDWSEGACRENGEFEEWETCVEWSKPTPVGACLTEATITLTTIFESEEVENHVFGSGNSRNYEAALVKMQKIAEDEINTEFTAVASYPVDPYGNVVKDPNLIRAYENATGNLRQPPLTGQHSLTNNFNKFAVECTTCDPRAICLPAGQSSGLQVDEVKCDCGIGWRWDEESQTCNNIDECQENNICHPSALCEDNDGSFTCKCPKMMRGDGFQCDIPDPLTENLLQEMLKQSGFGRSSKRSESIYWERFFGRSGATSTGLGECDVSDPPKFRHGDNPGKGCINEPLCCKSAEQCDCEGMPLPNSRREGLYDVVTDEDGNETLESNTFTGNRFDMQYTGVVAAFMNHLKHSQDLRCRKADAYKSMLGYDEGRCSRPVTFMPQIEFINLRPDSELGMFPGICELLRFAINLVIPGPLGVPECRTLGEKIIKPIMNGEFPDIYKCIYDSIVEAFESTQNSIDIFSAFVDQVEFPCPAKVLNQENFIGGVRKIADFIKQLFDLEELAKQASTIMTDWAETMKDQGTNVFNCEYSVLLGVDIGLSLPEPIGGIGQGSGLYVTYGWEMRDLRTGQRHPEQEACLAKLECIPVQQLLEIGSYDAIDSSGSMVSSMGLVKESVNDSKGVADFVNAAAAANSVDDLPDDVPEASIGAAIGIQVVQGNKNVWGGFGQTIDIDVSVPSPLPPLKATAGFSLIFGADCNENYKMGNILGFGFTIGAEISTDQKPDVSTGMSCGYVRAQTILENVKNNDGTYTGNFHGIWEEENTRCDKHDPPLTGDDLAQCKLDTDLAACALDYRGDDIAWCEDHVKKVHAGEAEKLDTCATPENEKSITEAGIEMGKSMANAACSINNARMRWNDGAQKCAAIYMCQAKKCVEGFETWGADAKDRMGGCADNYKDACDPTDLIFGDFMDPPNTYPADNPDGSSNLPEDKQDCSNIQCDCDALMDFFGNDDFPRLAGAAAKCLEDTVFGDPKYRELIAWVMEADQVFLAAAGWAQNKLTEIHEGVMDFVGEAISVVEGVFTGDTTPAQLAEIGIDVIKGIPEIADSIPDVDWVLNNFIDAGGICHNIKEIIEDPGSVVDAAVDLATNVGGAVVDVAGDVGGAAADAAVDAGSSFIEVVIDTAEEVGGAIADGAGAAVDVAADVGSAVGGAVGGAVSSVFSGWGRRKRDTTTGHPLRSLMTGITRGGFNFNQAVSDCCNGISRKKRSAEWDCQNPAGFVGNVLESGVGLINTAGDLLGDLASGRKKRSADEKKEEITRKLEKQFLSKSEMKFRKKTFGKYNKTLLEMRMEAKMVGALLNNKKFTKLLNLPEKSKNLGRSSFATMVCRMARKVEGCANLKKCVMKEAALVAIHGVAQNFNCQVGMLMPGAECIEEGDNFEPQPDMISPPWEQAVDIAHDYACDSKYSDGKISKPVSAMQTGKPNPSLQYMDNLV